MSKVIKGNKITWVEAILIITDLVPSLGVPQSIQYGLGIGVDEVTDTIKAVSYTHLTLPTLYSA